MMDPAIISLKDFFKGIYFKNLHTQLNQTSEQNLGWGGSPCLFWHYCALNMTILQ